MDKLACIYSCCGVVAISTSHSLLSRARSRCGVGSNSTASMKATRCDGTLRRLLNSSKDGFGSSCLSVECCIFTVQWPSVPSRLPTVSLNVTGDIMLRDGAEPILADRCVLAARSPAFAQLLTNETKFGDRKLALHSVTTPVLRTMVKAMYQGATPSVVVEAP